MITVNPKSYRQLIKHAGGVCNLIILNIVMLAFTFCKIQTDYTIGRWARDQSIQQGQFMEFTITVFSFATGTAVCVLMRCLIIFGMSLRASRNVHGLMIAVVLRAPVNLFYDVTPTGVVLNRFSKDLQVLDSEVALTFGAAMVMLYQALSVLIVICLANWYIVATLPVMFGLSFWIFAFTIPAYRECTRIESVSKSPMINLINESGSGCSTIRAFNKQDEFLQKNYELLNKNVLALQVAWGTWCWFGVRMDVVAILMMASATVICMIFRATEDRVLLAMVLSYILQLQSYLLQLLYCLGDLEREMVSI